MCPAKPAAGSGGLLICRPSPITGPTKLTRHHVALPFAGKIIERMDILEATKSGDYDQVRKLVTVDKVNVNQKDEDGATPLMFAAMRGQLAIAELLVDNKAEVDFQDEKSGWTALMQATYYGHKSVVRLLIDSGTNVSVQAGNGCTAFDIASITGETEVVRLLAAASMQPQQPRNRNRNRGIGEPPLPWYPPHGADNGLSLVCATNSCPFHGCLARAGRCSYMRICT